MAHPEIENLSGFACELLVLTDEEGRSLCVPLVQATFAIAHGAVPVLLERQPPIALGGQTWDDPAISSIRFEPQIAFMKPATDVVLHGHAYPSNQERTEGTVGVRVGPVRKVARVFGDRRVIPRMGFNAISEPEPFDRIPLIYEHAFGGRDQRHADPSRHSFEPRNPVGRGYRDPDQGVKGEWLLPNLEDPEHLYRSPGDRPPPVGFGYVAPDWPPRSAYAGTYDKAWSDSRKPLLPTDFDRRFFNAASPGLVAPGYLVGDEPISVIGASETGRVDFTLPGLPAPTCRVMLRRGKPAELQTVLDTVLIDMDSMALTLTWRAHVPVQRGLHDVAALQLPPAPPPSFDDEDDA